MEMKYSDKGTRSLLGREMYRNVQRQTYPLPSFTAVLTKSKAEQKFENYYHFHNCTSNFKEPQ